MFPILNHGDVLRMRRVCKPIKAIADDFIWTNFKPHVREINETNYTFQKFINLNIPTTSLYLNNSSPSFFEDNYIFDFVQLYGNKITHVKIQHFGTFISEHELHFFANLPNLQHLDISFIDASQRDCSYDQHTVNDVLVPREKSPFPPNFKNLKTLKLNEVQGSHPRDYGYAWDFIEFCENLEYVKHPYFKEPFFDKSKKPLGPFDCLMKYTRKRQQMQPDSPNLQYYDLQHYVETGYFLNEFCIVIKACYDRGVKLLNMHSDLFRLVAREFRPAPETFKIPLVSLKNVHGYMFCEELPNLEKLTIESTARSCYAFTWLGPWRFISIPVPKWPKLKTLDITIDSVKLTKNGQFPAKNIDELYNFLFVYAPETEKRVKLRMLAIRFSREPEGCEVEQLPVPKVQDITRSCPLVTKLILANWLGTNKAVAMFWEGLPFLEEVVLDNCEQLGDVAFVGKDKDDPVFLKLTGKQ